MSRDDVPDIGAVSMDRPEINRLFRERGYGILALADARESYPVPVSFGYDDDRLYFAFLETGEESKKATFAEATERGSFLVLDVAGKRDWRSVIAYGTVGPLDESEWDTAVEVCRDNAWHPSLFARSTPTQGIQWWAFDVREVTGRKAVGMDDRPGE